MISADLGLKLADAKMADLGRVRRVIADRDTTSIFGGGGLPGQIKARKDALDDAISATKAVVAKGIVAGGGLALLRCIPAMEKAAGQCRFDTAFPDATRAAGCAALVGLAGSATPRTQADLTSILRSFSMATEDFGKVTFRTPFSNRASILSVSTLAGTRNDR